MSERLCTHNTAKVTCTTLQNSVLVFCSMAVLTQVLYQHVQPELEASSKGVQHGAAQLQHTAAKPLRCAAEAFPNPLLLKLSASRIPQLPAMHSQCGNRAIATHVFFLQRALLAVVGV